MGMHLCYELHLSCDTPEADVRAGIDELHRRALVLPFQYVSPVVRVAPGDRVPPSAWSYRDPTDFVRNWAAITSEPVDAEGTRCASGTIGITIEVRDETGYWASRDTAELVRNVHEMNGIWRGSPARSTMRSRPSPRCVGRSSTIPSSSDWRWKSAGSDLPPKRGP